MKKLYLLSIIAMMFSITSCDWLKGKDDVVKQEDSVNSDIPEIQDSIKRHLVAQDSLYRGLVDQIDMLTLELNSSKTELASINKTIKQEDSRLFWNVLTIIATILSFFSIFLTWLISKQSIAYDHAKDLIGKMNIKVISKFEERLVLFESKISNIIYSNNNHTPIFNIEEIENLKRRIDMIEKDIHNKSPLNIPAIQLSNSSRNKIGYAKFSTQGYFTEILTTNDPSCVYKLTFIGENKAEFSLISLFLLRQSPEWKNVVETTGSCKIDDAQDFKELSKGVCEMEQGAWRVTKKLKIEIIK